jgi:aminobenzoyl-glutamate transport protein
MVSHHASDAAYVVFIPLAAIVYAAAGRHPVAGLAAAFAAVSGGYAGNITPGQIDVLLFGFTQEAARIVEPGWTMNPVGNWWFILSIVIVFTPASGSSPTGWSSRASANGAAGRMRRSRPNSPAPKSPPDERRGLRRAGLAALRGDRALPRPHARPRLHPADQSKRWKGPPASAILRRADRRLLPDVRQLRYRLRQRDRIDQVGRRRHPHDARRHRQPRAVHRVRILRRAFRGDVQLVQCRPDHRDQRRRERCRPSRCPHRSCWSACCCCRRFLDLFIGSASAKWSALAPVVVPMFMLLGISPEMTTAAYRMGDSYTNIMTPLMSYFPLILAFARAGTGRSASARCSR